MEFRFRWDAEKISPMARPRARARKSYITWQVDFCQFRPILAQMCFGFLWANLFLWASTSHVQGSISNARGHLNQKSPLELPYKPKSWPKMWLGWPKNDQNSFAYFRIKADSCAAKFAMSMLGAKHQWYMQMVQILVIKSLKMIIPIKSSTFPQACCWSQEIVWQSL